MGRVCRWSLLLTVGALLGFSRVGGAPVTGPVVNSGENKNVSSDRDESRRRYRFNRDADTGDLTVEPVSGPSSSLRFHVTTDDDEEDDCGCHGQGYEGESTFGR